MAIVAKKIKKKTIKKTTPAKKESKFISQALVNRKLKSKGKKRKRPKTKGLIYVKNLPHGFFEEQLRGYFSQFGAITRLRLGRSPKTLNSRGYAFIEFRYPEVAEIAAQAMNNYIMFHRIIKTKYIPPQEIHHDYFRSDILVLGKGENKVLTSKKLLVRKSNVENTNRLMTDNDQKSRIAKIRAKHLKRKKTLEKLGIDFDVDEVAKNLSEDIVKEKSNNKLTIADLNEDEDDDDEADETFDPSKFDINEEDEFADFQYSSDDISDDELEKIKKDDAVKLAKEVSKKTAKEKNIVKAVEKKKQPAKKRITRKNEPSKEEVKVTEAEIKPTKEKKLAKTSTTIEKKKVSPYINEKKLKAAAVKVSEETTKTVKVVKKNNAKKVPKGKKN